MFRGCKVEQERHVKMWKKVWVVQCGVLERKKNGGEGSSSFKI